MIKYILKRLAIIVVTLIIIITATFFLMKLMPGSPLANAERLSTSQRKLIEAQYGLDRPMIVQYLSYLWNAFHFNFGVSFQYANQQVSTLIAQRMGPSTQHSIVAKQPPRMRELKFQGPLRLTKPCQSLCYDEPPQLIQGRFQR